jgi:glycosidase
MMATSVDAKTPSSCFGSAADLTTLVTTAHAKGLRVLFDHTIVHVHVTSDVYTQHANWFWTNAGQPWCTCGTANCDWDPATGQGLKCWFTNYLPHWNYSVPEARDFGVRMTLDWLTQYGIDGFRLDAVKHVDDAWLLATRSAITSEVVPQRAPGTRIYLVGETVDGNIATIAKYVDPTHQARRAIRFSPTTRPDRGRGPATPRASCRISPRSWTRTPTTTDPTRS